MTTIDQSTGSTDSLNSGRRGNPETGVDDLAARRRNIEQALLDAEGERISALVAAERGARQLVNGLNRAFDSAATERNCFAWLGRPAPLVISAPALADRMGQRLAAVLAGLSNAPGRLGPVAWYGTWRSGVERWGEQERAEIAGSLADFQGERP